MPVALIEFDSAEDDPGDDFGEDPLMRHLVAGHRGPAGQTPHEERIPK